MAVFTEYIRALSYAKLQVDSALHTLLIDLLARNGRYYQLHQFLQYHVLPDSLPSACRLLALEKDYPAAYQLAIDMFKRLKEDEQIQEVLLSKEEVQSLSFHNCNCSDYTCTKIFASPQGINIFYPSFLRGCFEE